MLKRIVVGAGLIALLAAVIWLDWKWRQLETPWLLPHDFPVCLRGAPLTILTALLVVAGFLELARMCTAAGLPLLRVGGLLGSLAIATLPLWRQFIGQVVGWGGTNDLPLLTLGLVMMWLFAEQLIFHRTNQVLRRIGVTLLAVGYLGVCGAVLLGMRMRFGISAFVLFLLVVKFTDIGAYFVGSAVGRHKLIPWLSPGKSWEGLVGGLIVAGCVAVAYAALLNHFFDETIFDFGQGVAWLPRAAFFGVVVGLFGQGADLCESALKRDTGFKDSGRSVPGFGGVLDVIDSPLLSAPVGYLLLAALR